MKRILLFFCAALFFLMSDPGLARSQSHLGFGIRSGANFATINGEDVDTRTTFMAGAYLNIPLVNSPVSFQPEVLYTRKGFKNDGITVKLDYLEIPVLARLRLGEGQQLQPHIYLGPFVGFNINAESEGREVSLDTPSDAPPNVPIDDLDN